jgi:hypothetical protein
MNNKKELDEELSEELSFALKDLLKEYTFCYGSDFEKIDFLMEHHSDLYSEYIKKRNAILKAYTTKLLQL